MQKLEEYLEKLGLREYTKIPIVKKIASKTKIPESIIVVSVLSLLLMLLFLPCISEIFTTIFIFTIPAFETFRALKSKSTKDDEELLTYWIVFSTLYTFDSLFRFILGYFGFYTILRFSLLSFIFYSKKYGSKLIYARLVKPFFEKFGERIDALVRPIEEQGRRISRFIQIQKDEFSKLNEMKESMGEDKEKTE